MNRKRKFIAKWRRVVSTILLTAPIVFAVELNAGNAVTDWTTIASTTIVKNGGKSPGASSVWFAYASLAVYGAVNAVTGQDRPPFHPIGRPAHASVEAAAAAAAHRILVNYFPAQQASLDAQFTTSLASIVDASSRDKGVAIGEAAALAVISARIGDGLEANVPYVPGSGPGAWIPTPPAFGPPVTPWLGQMRPFAMKTASDFLPGPPPALDSETWKRDYNLTRLYGDVNSTVRSANETEIGTFWTEHTGQQYARAFNYLVDTYHLSTPDSARLMVMLWTGYADAAIGCYNAKYKYGFWRPVTAIQAGGGSTDLTAYPSWMPLGVTPAHPEYPAAHACITGAVAPLIAAFFGGTAVHVIVDSIAFAGAAHQHVFEDTRDLIDEVFWARIYAGFHYHHSLEAGRDLGGQVAGRVAQELSVPRQPDR